MQKHRISTNIGRDQKVIVELKNDFDLLEILSLKFTQTEAYSSMCSDYGVVCGRIFVNNGFGVPNAKVSIFIPITDEDSNDPVISSLYPFTTIDDRNEEGYRYNLLPSRKQHGGHEPTGTFPDQIDILTREEILEVYEKYYKYTVKTNESGDFMIWGVPVGSQTIHVDVDLSDIGCFSLRPDDFIKQGKSVDNFKNTYTYKSSEDIDSLPQIVSFNQTVEVYPFWGNEDLCEIGITRTDFDLSTRGVNIQPKSYLLGSIYSDQGTNTISKNCRPKGKMGRKCDLTTFKAVIEMIRFTNNKDSLGRPILETYELNEDIDESGSFVLSLPMNMDYVFTNEFGENEISNDPNKGIATSACYRLRISGKNETLGRVRSTASYLIPNIREYTNDVDKSYAFSLNWDDYPTSSLNSNVIFNNVFGSYFPEDYFYRFTYNKVYGVSSYMGGEYTTGRDNFLGIKEIAPKEDEDCESNVVTPPSNFAFRKFSFGILLAIILNAFERVIYTAFVGAIQVIIFPFQKLWEFRIYIRGLIDWKPFYWMDKSVIEPLQRLGTVNLSIVTYPECESCDEVEDTRSLPQPNIDPEQLYQKVGEGVAVRDILSLTVRCDTYDFTSPSTNSSYEYIDCSTGTLETLNILTGNTVTGLCVRSGSLSLVSGDDTSSIVSTCDTIITYTPICDADSNERDVILTGATTSPLTTYTPSVGLYGESLLTVQNNLVNSPPVIYYIKIKNYLPHGDATVSDLLLLNSLEVNGSTDIFYKSFDGTSCPGGGIGFGHGDINNNNTWLKWNNGGNTPVDYVWTGFTYELYSEQYPLSGSTSDGLNTSALPEGCKSYNTFYDENIVNGTYCEFNIDDPYGIVTPGTSCIGGKIPVGQIISETTINKCDTCVTKSGFSELRFGIFTIIPAADSSNWRANLDAIKEYSRRKLVGKLFCEGITNYSFVDNWLTGSLYLFPFKARVRWDNEENLDLNVRGTKYCEDLVYLKVKESSSNNPVKRFYYRSSTFNPSTSTFTKTIKSDNSDSNPTLGHPTTIVDMGPRDEFIKEICVDPNLDPNCSVVRSIGPSSYQNIKELIGLYLNYRMDANDYDYRDFFQNTGYNLYPSSSQKLVLNGDLLQLISINNEVGVEEFDLQTRNYGVYSPLILDPDNEPNFFESQSGTPNGPLPLNFALDPDGFRVRVCLNEPGRLTESSQIVPFFYWNKGGLGFGEGVNQSWSYSSPVSQRLQGMTYDYRFTGFNDNTYNYVLFPMTKTYSGFTQDGPDINDVGFDIESLTDNHTLYDQQEEGFTYLYITSGTTLIPLTGILYTRVGNAGNWSSIPWDSTLITYIIKPTEYNYNGNQQILSTPFLFYFGLRPGNTAVDKFIERFGPKDAFPSAE
jgi:hypothetical protein